MTRTADASIEPFFLRRWSPRSMSGAVVSQDDLRSLLEAARWAPSSGNSQPWRFVVAQRDTPAFQRLFDTLMEGNKPWCQRAGAFVLVTSKTVSDKGQPLRTHAFDTGAAWVSLALQGSAMGLVVHGMGGFDYAQAATVVGLPENHEVHCLVAIGHPGSVDDLAEPYRSREAPNGRNPTSSFMFDGEFPKATEQG